MTPHALSVLTQLHADAFEAGASPHYREALHAAIIAGRVELAARKPPKALVTGRRCVCCGTFASGVHDAAFVCAVCEREAAA